MWEINKAFLQQQMDVGKSFVFTSDPTLADVQSFTARELKFLSDNGYEIKMEAGGLYRAIKN